MNRLGDPQDSPIRKILETAYDQTSWDNPSLANVTIKKAQTGVVNWVKQWFTRSQAGQMAAANIDINGNPAEVPMGPIGQEFVGLARIVATHDGTSMLKGYMDTLSKVRTRFNVIKNQGDPGPGARQLMQQTLDGNGSELADSLKFVDEQMLTGLTDSQRKSLRPLLVRPLMQAFSVVIQPASAEVNKVWNAQVYQPFQSSLATKYPFAPNAKVEAGAGEIAQVFGPDGAIAKFVGTTLGRSRCAAADTLAARTWGDMGIGLTPDFTNGFARWVAPLAGGAAGGAAAASNRRPCSRSCRSRAPARPNTRSRSTASNCVTATRRRSGPTSCGRTRRVRRRDAVRDDLRRPHGAARQRAGPLRSREADQLGAAQAPPGRHVRSDVGPGQRERVGDDAHHQHVAARPAAATNLSSRACAVCSCRRRSPTSAGAAQNATRRAPARRPAPAVAAATATNAQGRNDANRSGADRLLRQDSVARRLREEPAQPAAAADARSLDRAGAGAARGGSALEDRLRGCEADAFRVPRLAQQARDRGHMVASHDVSMRRFPFLGATALEVERPLAFLARSPLAFARLWSRVAAQMPALLAKEEPPGALQARRRRCRSTSAAPARRTTAPSTTSSNTSRCTGCSRCCSRAAIRCGCAARCSRSARCGR
jgi:hypothetical protein